MPVGRALHQQRVEPYVFGGYWYPKKIKYSMIYCTIYIYRISFNTGFWSANQSALIWKASMISAHAHIGWNIKLIRFAIGELTGIFCDVIKTRSI